MQEIVLNLLKFNYDFTNFSIEDKEFENIFMLVNYFQQIILFFLGEIILIIFSF